MTLTKPDDRLQTNVRRGKQTVQASEQNWLDACVVSSWLDMVQHVAWHGGYALDQIISRQDENGWMLILKAIRREQPYAAFISARTFPEACELAAEFAERGVLTWLPDKWPSHRVKRLLGQI